MANCVHRYFSQVGMRDVLVNGIAANSTYADGACLPLRRLLQHNAQKLFHLFLLVGVHDIHQLVNVFLFCVYHKSIRVDGDIQLCHSPDTPDV